MRRYLQEIKGFTLIELVLVVASIAILAAILVATILSILDDAKVAKHKADVKSIAAAVVKHDVDTGEFATRNSETNPTETSLLYSGTTAPGTDFSADGAATAANPTAVGLTSFACENIVPGGSGFNCESFEFPFITNAVTLTGVAYTSTGKKKWIGPYLSENSQDEFGKPYIVYVRRLRRSGAITTERSWIVAAGPNKVYQTTPGSTSACAGNTTDCDDIVFLIK
jgi:type II secretory pathway pseudopilin PulG